jgi:hypothetical protein
MDGASSAHQPRQNQPDNQVRFRTRQSSRAREDVVPRATLHSAQISRDQLLNGTLSISGGVRRHEGLCDIPWELTMEPTLASAAAFPGVAAYNPPWADDSRGGTERIDLGPSSRCEGAANALSSVSGMGTNPPALRHWHCARWIRTLPSLGGQHAQ